MYDSWYQTLTTNYQPFHHYSFQVSLCFLGRLHGRLSGGNSWNSVGKSSIPFYEGNIGKPRGTFKESAVKQCFGRTQPITYKQLCCLFRFPWRWHISHHAGLLHGLLRCAPPSWSYTLGVGGRAGTFSFGSSFYNQMVKWCIILAFSLHVRSPYETSHPSFMGGFLEKEATTSSTKYPFTDFYVEPWLHI